MRLFRKKPKRSKYVYVHFWDENGLEKKYLEYPTDMPIPHIGGYLQLNSWYGRVRSVYYQHSGLVSMVNIHVNMEDF